MLNYTPLKIDKNKNISKSMIALGGIVTIFAFGILGFLAWTLQSIQVQNVYLADRLDTYTSKNRTISSSSQGDVAGAQTSTVSVLPPEAETTRKKVESIIIVPIVGDIPTFALIDDLAKVKNEAFFAKAQVGDHLFVYSKSKMAILYRPSALKIVNVADINQGDQSQSVQEKQNLQMQQTANQDEQASTIDEEKSSVLIVSSQGVEASKISNAREVLGRIKGVLLTEDSASVLPDALSKNKVANISGNQDIVNSLMSEFSAEEAPLPSGINANGADIVLILAKD